ncbi:MAG TPA: hypothetical protein VF049_12840 [Nocardioidaceae bacterium]|jgi:hypothetical protein
MRLPFRRSAQAPPEVVSRAPLEPGEAVLAAAAMRDGTWLLGTRDALLLVPPDRVTQAEVRIAWEKVQRADWDREQNRLRVSEVGEFGRMRPEHVLTVDEPGRLLQLVRERVTASVVLQRRVRISGKKGLTVIARRPPGRSGEITWAYEFDSGVDPDDPDVMDAAERALASAAEELGL